MSLGKAIAVTVGSFVFLALAGYFMGIVLASSSPNYYMIVFGLEEKERVHIGTLASTTGLFQGMIAGLVVGLALVALFIWREIAMTKAKNLG